MYLIALIIFVCSILIQVWLIIHATGDVFHAGCQMSAGATQEQKKSS
jgi:hypothetical protein